MDNQDNQVYNWVVKKGNLVMFADNDRIHLEVNKENHPLCELTWMDANEVKNIMTSIAGSIWDNPAYTREPYTNKLYQQLEDGRVSWDINGTKLTIGINEDDEVMEINAEGNPVMSVSVNAAVEIVQIMQQFLRIL